MDEDFESVPTYDDYYNEYLRMNSKIYSKLKTPNANLAWNLCSQQFFHDSIGSESAENVCSVKILNPNSTIKPLGVFARLPVNDDSSNKNVKYLGSLNRIILPDDNNNMSEFLTSKPEKVDNSEIMNIDCDESAMKYIEEENVYSFRIFDMKGKKGIKIGVQIKEKKPVVEKAINLKIKNLECYKTILPSETFSINLENLNSLTDNRLKSKNLTIYIAEKVYYANDFNLQVNFATHDLDCSKSNLQGNETIRKNFESDCFDHLGCRIPIGICCKQFQIDSKTGLAEMTSFNREKFIKTDWE